MTIISESEDDIWFHREKDQTWWTLSLSEPATISEGIDPSIVGDQRVYVCHKPCEPWSNHNKLGNRLDWGSLHPRAKEFLFTEGTLQQLSADNAEYALALLAGDDLTRWHSKPEWLGKLAKAKSQPAKIMNAAQRAAIRMAMTAFSTAANANGQEVSRTVKNKEVRFTQPELEAYLLALIESQEHLCALTELPMQLDGENHYAELLPSLDRIDSDGHYEVGNLQVVCRFANRWKGADKDDKFRRLVAILQGNNIDARSTTGH